MSAGSVFFQAEDGIRDRDVTGFQTCALPIYRPAAGAAPSHPRRVRAAGLRLCRDRRLRHPELGLAGGGGGALARVIGRAPCRDLGGIRVGTLYVLTHGEDTGAFCRRVALWAL